jgi:alanyl-tRNA synthetase
MKASELRQKYLNFFKEKGHTIIPSASLIPKEDPTVLFTTAGMHPLVPYLLGEKHPGGQRLVNVQKCIRTVDIESVGDPTHNTFFEMLGNWSLGDYFKKEALEWSWEFLTSPQWLSLEKGRMAASVFAGDQDALFDQEAFNLWKEIGISEKRIAKLPKVNNWWGPAGETGPCGPDSEIFYWVGDENKAPASFNDDNDLWVEIWNNVFMEYNKKADGAYERLSQQNVDTGMGLERLLMIFNGLDDVYKTELFWPLIVKIQVLSGKQYGQSKEITKAMRIIADHLRAATFILGDENGVAPSNVEQGYVLRRLIRRAIRFGRQIGITGMFTTMIAEETIKIFRETYPEIGKNKDFIVSQLFNEEEKFRGALEKGLKEFEKVAGDRSLAEGNVLVGQAVFRLYDTYGFPVEMTKELAEERGLQIDEEGFKNAFLKHQELSRAGAEQKFKGGLADHSELTKKLHTATHLLLAALRQVLGPYVFQKGSNITADRLRLDFSHDRKMVKEELKQVEDLVNEQIKKDLEVMVSEMSLEEAKREEAMGVFESKYDERVKVYTIGNPSAGSGQVFSKEICGGPHVERTRELGKFRIIKEEASSAGVRRIKAVLE